MRGGGTKIGFKTCVPQVKRRKRKTKIIIILHIIFAIVKFLFFQADRSKVEITTVNLEESYDSKIFVEWAPLTF